MSEPRRAAEPRIPPKYLLGGLLSVLMVFLFGFCSGVSDAQDGDHTGIATPSPPPPPTAVGGPVDQPSSATPAPSATELETIPGSALDTLINKLTVARPQADTSYARAKFGSAWEDVDGNGCDQCNDVLRRDLRNRHTVPGTGGCILAKGDLKSPYSGETVFFVKGEPGVQIDHVVALKNAWMHGASTWTDKERVKYANDFLNLLPVESELNQAKSDSDTWLPAKNRCQFAARKIAVKDKYQLSVSAEEADVLTDVLEACPQQKLPTVKSAQPPKPKPIGEPKPQPAPEPTAEPESGADPHYGTCAEAKANGYGPYRSGDTEYDWYKDQDGDGITCE